LRNNVAFSYSEFPRRRALSVIHGAANNSSFFENDLSELRGRENAANTTGRSERTIGNIFERFVSFAGRDLLPEKTYDD